MTTEQIQKLNNDQDLSNHELERDFPLLSLRKSIRNIKQLLNSILEIIKQWQSDYQRLSKAFKSLIIVCNSLPIALFQQDIIYEMISVLRISLKLDFMHKNMEPNFEYEWLGRVVTFNNLAWVMFKFGHMQTCFAQVNYSVFICNKAREMNKFGENEIDFQVSTNIFAAQMLQVSQRYEESVKFSSKAMDMLIEHKISSVPKYSEQHKNLVLILTIAFIFYSVGKMVQNKVFRETAMLIDDFIYTHQKMNGFNPEDQLPGKFLLRIKSNWSQQYNLELPNLNKLELEEIILIDPSRIINKESIIELYNLSALDPDTLQYSNSNNDLILTEGFEKLVFSHVYSPFAAKTIGQIDDSELEILQGLKYIQDEQVIQELQECEKRLNTSQGMFYQKMIKLAKQKQKERHQLNQKEVEIDKEHLEDIVASKKQFNPHNSMQLEFKQQEKHKVQPHYEFSTQKIDFDANFYNQNNLEIQEKVKRSPNKNSVLNQMKGKREYILNKLEKHQNEHISIRKNTLSKKTTADPNGNVENKGLLIRNPNPNELKAIKSSNPSIITKRNEPHSQSPDFQAKNENKHSSLLPLINTKYIPSEETNLETVKKARSQTISQRQKVEHHDKRKRSHNKHNISENQINEKDIDEPKSISKEYITNKNNLMSASMKRNQIYNPDVIEESQLDNRENLLLKNHKANFVKFDDNKHKVKSDKENVHNDQLKKIKIDPKGIDEKQKTNKLIHNDSNFKERFQQSELNQKGYKDYENAAQVKDQLVQYELEQNDYIVYNLPKNKNLFKYKPVEVAPDLRKVIEKNKSDKNQKSIYDNDKNTSIVEPKNTIDKVVTFKNSNIPNDEIIINKNEREIVNKKEIVAAVLNNHEAKNDEALRLTGDQLTVRSENNRYFKNGEQTNRSSDQKLESIQLSKDV